MTILSDTARRDGCTPVVQGGRQAPRPSVYPDSRAQLQNYEQGKMSCSTGAERWSEVDHGSHTEDSCEDSDATMPSSPSFSHDSQQSVRDCTFQIPCSSSGGESPPARSTLSDTPPSLGPQASMPERCPRTLEIDYYERDDETLRRKWAHMDFVDANYDNREQRILETTLATSDIVLEKNAFPYVTPEGVGHYTLWGLREMSSAEIENYVCDWIAKNMPQATAWQFDENETRSIDLFHVHVYIQVHLHVEEHASPDCDKVPEETVVSSSPKCLKRVHEASAEVENVPKRMCQSWEGVPADMQACLSHCAK